MFEKQDSAKTSRIYFFEAIQPECGLVRKALVLRQLILGQANAPGVANVPVSRLNKARAELCGSTESRPPRFAMDKVRQAPRRKTFPWGVRILLYTHRLAARRLLHGVPGRALSDTSC